MNKNVYESAETLPKPEQQSYLGSQTAESVILDDVAQPQTLIHRPQDDQSFRGDFVDLFMLNTCLLYTSPSPRDLVISRMPSSA